MFVWFIFPLHKETVVDKAHASLIIKGEKMKKAIAVTVLALCFTIPLTSIAKESTDQKIEQLQKQIDQLKADQKAKDEGQNYVKSKFPVELYGFVDAQFNVGTARTQMYGGLNSEAVQSRVINKTAANGGRHTWFGANPQNSRLGLNWKGSKVSDKLSIGGLFEIDFVNVLNNTSYGTSPIPRIRHLYLDLASTDNWSIIAGQTWDIYSPLNTGSISLGGNLWFQGNMGFRRPQVRFTYNYVIDETNKIKFAVSANHPQNTDDLVSTTGIGSNSGIPVGEGLVQYNRKMNAGDLVVAVSGNAGANSLNGKYTKVAGICGSLSIPFHKLFKVSGEVQYGQDQGIFLSYVNSTGNTLGNRDLGFWAQLQSQWHTKFDTAIGYAMDDIKSTKILTGNVDRNQVMFANFRFFPIKPFYFGIEYNYMRTSYKGSGTSPANIIFSNLVYTF